MGLVPGQRGGSGRVFVSSTHSVYRGRESRSRKDAVSSLVGPETATGTACTMAFVMREFFRRWWPWLKVALFVAILFGVGWQFIRILQSEELQKTDQARSPAKILWDEARVAHPAGLVASGALYLLGLSFSAFFWLHV